MECPEQTLSDKISKDDFGPLLDLTLQQETFAPSILWESVKCGFIMVFLPCINQLCKNLTLPLKLMWFTNLNLHSPIHCSSQIWAQLCVQYKIVIEWSEEGSNYSMSYVWSCKVLLLLVTKDRDCWLRSRYSFSLDCVPHYACLLHFNGYKWHVKHEFNIFAEENIWDANLDFAKFLQTIQPSPAEALYGSLRGGV